jgi:hypothetical protein
MVAIFFLTYLASRMHLWEQQRSWCAGRCELGEKGKESDLHRVLFISLS